MIPDISRVRIFIQPGFTDMRKAINGLSLHVQSAMKKNPMDGNLYVFCGRSRRSVKIIYWDRNGFCLWQKRLEDDKFHWPRTSEEAREITKEEFRWFLIGLNFYGVHKEKHFSVI